MRRPDKLRRERSGQLRRRDIIALFGSTAVWPGLAIAESPNKHPIIGLLTLNASEQDDPEVIGAFREALATLGYVDGKTATIVVRYAGGNFRKLNSLAKEVAASGPNVVLADSASPIKAMREAAPSVPIVGAVMGYAVELGLIASFAHPGGNITGIASGVEDMSGKQLELAIEAIGGARSMGLLRNPDGAGAEPYLRELRAAADKRGITIHTADARVPEEIESAIQQLADARVSFLYVQPNGLFNAERNRVAQLAVSWRMPAISSLDRYATAGLLMTYGVKIVDNYRRAAVFVDKILKGSKPADLPVEFPTVVNLVINLKTARALGIAISQSLLLRASEVIE